MRCYYCLIFYVQAQITCTEQQCYIDQWHCLILFHGRSFLKKTAQNRLRTWTHIICYCSTGANWEMNSSYRLLKVMSMESNSLVCMRWNICIVKIFCNHHTGNYFLYIYSRGQPAPLAWTRGRLTGQSMLRAPFIHKDKDKQRLKRKIDACWYAICSALMISCLSSFVYAFLLIKYYHTDSLLFCLNLMSD